MTGTTCISSGLLTADAAVYVGRGTLNAVTVLTDGTNAATLTIYDNASAASGNVLYKCIVPGATSQKADVYNLAIRCLNGLYADISGTGAAYIIHFGA